MARVIGTNVWPKDPVPPVMRMEELVKLNLSFIETLYIYQLDADNISSAYHKPEAIAWIQLLLRDANQYRFLQQNNTFTKM